MNNPDTGESARTVYDRLTRLFQHIAAAAPTRIDYAALDEIKGAKIIFSDEKHPVITVWADGNDVRAYESRYGEGKWRAMKSGVLSENVDAPPGFPPPLRESSGAGDERQADDEPLGLPINTALNRPRWMMTAGTDSY